MGVSLRIDAINNQCVGTETLEKLGIARYWCVVDISNLARLIAVGPMVDFSLSGYVHLRIAELRNVGAAIQLQVNQQPARISISQFRYPKGAWSTALRWQLHRLPQALTGLVGLTLEHYDF